VEATTHSRTFRMFESSLSKPCTRSTAKLSICREESPFAPRLFCTGTLERSISSRRSSIDICTREGISGYKVLNLFPVADYYVNSRVKPKVHVLNKWGHFSYACVKSRGRPIWFFLGRYRLLVIKGADSRYAFTVTQTPTQNIL